MTEYRYGYLLTISDDEGMLCKYDYLLTNEILFNNSAVYDNLSGVDLCRYDLDNEQDNEYFISNVTELNNGYGIKQINILTNLANELLKFYEV